MRTCLNFWKDALVVKMVCWVNFMPPMLSKSCRIRYGTAQPKTCTLSTDVPETILFPTLWLLTSVNLRSLRLMRAVMQKKDRKGSWREQEVDEVQLMSGCVQNFSDKSQTSLDGVFLKLHFLHITFSDFTEKFKRHFILPGKSVVGNLPISVEN